MQITISNGTLNSFSQTLNPANGYRLPETVTVTGASYTYNRSAKTLVLFDPTSEVTFTADGQPLPSDKELVTYADLYEFKDQIINIILKYGCGYYDPDKWYDIGDVTCYNRRYYVCISNTLGGILPTNTSYWIPLVVSE